MNKPIDTRVGQILDDDNRFLGRSVFSDWERELRSPSDTLLVALGARELTSLDREAIRLVSLCLISPDARVWPLKLTRLLSSRGDAVAGYLGGQLVTAGRVMGPGAGRHAARCLHRVGESTGLDPSTEEVRAAVDAWKREAGTTIIGGFGVPFRPQDERRVALVRFVGDGPLARRRHWQLHFRVVEALAPTPPNVVISIVALLLDVGVPAERCGLAVSVLMQHVFLAHALEAAQTDGALTSLPRELVGYRGIAARHTSAPGTPEIERALRRSPGPSPAHPGPKPSTLGSGQNAALPSSS